MNPKTHIYLYAKHWYKSTDVESDLRKIMSDYTGLNEKYITTQDIQQVLYSETFSHLSKKNEFANREFVFDVARRGIILACLSVLLVAEVESLNLGKPDSSILPLQEGY